MENFKPFLEKKSKKFSKITSIEDNLSHKIKKSQKYLTNSSILNMPTNQEFEYSDSLEEDPLLRIIGKYQNHPSINLIRFNNKSQTFKFKENNTDAIKKSIENLEEKTISKKLHWIQTL